MKQNMSHNLRRLLCRNDGFDRYARFAAIPSAEIYRSVGLLRTEYAPVMELVDMRDLGSRAAMRVGSSPFRRTTSEQASYRLLRLIFISQNALILLLPLSHSDLLRRAHSGRDTLRTAFSVTGKVSVRLSSSEILGLARSPAMRRGSNRGFSTGFPV